MVKKEGSLRAGFALQWSTTGKRKWATWQHPESWQRTRTQQGSISPVAAATVLDKMNARHCLKELQAHYHSAYAQLCHMISLASKTRTQDRSLSPHCCPSVEQPSRAHSLDPSQAMAFRPSVLWLQGSSSDHQASNQLLSCSEARVWPRGIVLRAGH